MRKKRTRHRALAPAAELAVGIPRGAGAIRPARTPDAGARPARPLPPGGVGPAPSLEKKVAERLFRAALRRAAGAGKGRGDVLWREAGHALLLRPARARLETAERLVVVIIPVHSDVSGDADVVVPFVLESVDEPPGLLAATESVPRGPPAVVDRFGEALVTAAWAALVETASAWAAAAGWKDAGAPHVEPNDAA